MRTKAGYAQYLGSQHWAKLRALKLAQAGARCQRCGSKLRIQVHHLHYRDNWLEVELEDLEVLCRRCHRRQHGVRPKPKRHTWPLATQLKALAAQEGKGHGLNFHTPRRWQSRGTSSN